MVRHGGYAAAHVFGRRQQVAPVNVLLGEMIFQRKNTVVKPGFSGRSSAAPQEKRHCGMRVRVGLKDGYQQISAAVFHRVGFKGFFLADVNYLRRRLYVLRPSLLYRRRHF